MTSANLPATGDRPESLATLPVLPLKNTVLFPYLFLPLSAGRPISLAAAEAAIAGEDKTFLALAQRNPEAEEPTPDDLYTVGTRAVIKKMARSAAGLELLVQGVERVAVVRLEKAENHLRARVRPLPMPDDQGPEIEALRRAVLDLTAQAIALTQSGGISIEQLAAQAQDPLMLAYLIGSMLSLDVVREQALLEAPTRLEALRLLHGYLANELKVLELRQKIASQAQTEMSKEQRDYMLRQQLRAIQDELGEKNPETQEVEELRRRFDEADLPDDVRKEVERDLGRLERLPPAAPDYQITRTYLELVLELPWQRSTDDILDLERAQMVLDEDHYDLEKIKERILEHLAVLKLNPSAKAPILCFVGPPGVGKTSLGQSIARALDRKFERMSLGGLHDESELRGHRRTYIGAMPGRIIQAIRRAGVNNPVLMLDEVDKLGRDFRGDPTSALLEILDPAQNATFRDNYLDLPFDLSKVFFIATANAIDVIPPPLLDRMELLRLSGYSEEEKVQIAVRYLVPRQREQAGLKAEDLTIPPDVIRVIISRYTREAGVRELERMIGRVARKVARRFAEGHTEPVTVAKGDLEQLLGPERFFLEQARKSLGAGRGDRAGLDRGRRRRAVRRGPAAPRRPRPAAHGSARRRDARVGSDGDVLRLVQRPAARRGSRHLPPHGGPHPRAGRRRAQGRPVGRGHHGDGPDLALHQAAGPQRHRHDGRDHAHRDGPAGRRDQGEGPRRPPGGDPPDHPPGRQREGPARAAGIRPRGPDLHRRRSDRGRPEVRHPRAGPAAGGRAGGVAWASGFVVGQAFQPDRG